MGTDEMNKLLRALIGEDQLGKLRAAGVVANVSVASDSLDEQAIMEVVSAAITETHRDSAKCQRLAALGTVSAGLVHEVRNMLTAVKGFAQMAQTQPDQKKTSVSLDRIVSETTRALEVLSQMLSFARNRPRTTALFNLCDAVERAAQATRHQLRIHDVALEIERGDTILMVMGSSGEFEQVLVNLILNAQQAITGRGSVSVELTRQGDTGVLRVSDTGPGVPPEHAERLFEPFYTTKSSGTGLGLAICRRIIEEHDGTIEFSSEPGKGTTFVIEIPLADDPGAQA